MAENQKTPQQMAAELSALLETIRGRDNELYKAAKKVLDPTKSWLRDWKAPPNVDQLKQEIQRLTVSVQIYKRAHQVSVRHATEQLQKLLGEKGQWMNAEREELWEAISIFHEREELLKQEVEPLSEIAVSQVTNAVHAAMVEWRDECPIYSHVKYHQPRGSGEGVSKKVVSCDPKLLIHCLTKLLQHLHVHNVDENFAQLFVEDGKNSIKFCGLTSQMVVPVHMQLGFFSEKPEGLQNFGIALPFWLSTFFDPVGLQIAKADKDIGGYLCYFRVPKVQK